MGTRTRCLDCIYLKSWELEGFNSLPDYRCVAPGNISQAEPYWDPITGWVEEYPVLLRPPGAGSRNMHGVCPDYEEKPDVAERKVIDGQHRVRVAKSVAEREA